MTTQVRGRRSTLALLAGSCLATSLRAFSQTSTTTKAVVASFKAYTAKHTASYRTDRRPRVSKLGGGWAKLSYEAKPDYTIDVRATDSLISPFIGICEFMLIESRSELFSTRRDAESASVLGNRREIKHRHTYAYQEGKWIPRTRQHHSPFLGEWFDCNEVISEGENKGETNIMGCFEKG